MKRFILGLVLGALCISSACGQGQVFFDILNASQSPNATSEGRCWILTGSNYSLLTLDHLSHPSDLPVYGKLLGGASPAALAVLARGVGGGDPSAALLDYNLVPGQYFDDFGSAFFVPGVAAGDTAYFQVFVWIGNYSSYASAVAAGGWVSYTPVFSQSIGGGTITPPGLTGIPAVLIPLPEPGPISLVGLGVITLLVFRKRA